MLIMFGYVRIKDNDLLNLEIELRRILKDVQDYRNKRYFSASPILSEKPKKDDSVIRTDIDALKKQLDRLQITTNEYAAKRR